MRPVLLHREAAPYRVPAKRVRRCPSARTRPRPRTPLLPLPFGPQTAKLRPARSKVISLIPRNLLTISLSMRIIGPRCRRGPRGVPPPSGPRSPGECPAQAFRRRAAAFLRGELVGEGRVDPLDDRGRPVLRLLWWLAEMPWLGASVTSTSFGSVRRGSHAGCEISRETAAAVKGVGICTIPVREAAPRPPRPERNEERHRWECGLGRIVAASLRSVRRVARSRRFTLTEAHRARWSRYTRIPKPGPSSTPLPLYQDRRDRPPRPSRAKSLSPVITYSTPPPRRDMRGKYSPCLGPLWLKVRTCGLLYQVHYRHRPVPGRVMVDLTPRLRSPAWLSRVHVIEHVHQELA